MKYKVLLSDPFHGNQSRTYSTASQAFSAARKIVDSFLVSVYRPGMSLEDLIDTFDNFGEQPLVVSSQSRLNFSASDYARKKARELCGDRNEENTSTNLLDPPSFPEE